MSRLSFTSNSYRSLLALLDYVSRANEIEIRPSSVCSIDYLWSYCMDFFKFQLWLPLGHMPRLFFIFEKKNCLNFYEYFSFSLTWDPMGAKTSKRYSSFKSLLNPFNLFLNFLLSGPDKSTVLDFWNFEFLTFQEFCSFSLTWDPMGAKTSKRYSSLKSLLNPLKPFPEFSSELSSQKYCFGCLKF